MLRTRTIRQVGGGECLSSELSRVIGQLESPNSDRPNNGHGRKQRHFPIRRLGLPTFEDLPHCLQSRPYSPRHLLEISLACDGPFRYISRSKRLYPLADFFSRSNDRRAISALRRAFWRFFSSQLEGCLVARFRFVIAESIVEDLLIQIPLLAARRQKVS